MRFKQSGDAITYKTTTIHFTPDPYLLWCGRLVSIDQPQRFGDAWRTLEDRLRYTRRFHATTSLTAPLRA